MHLISFNEIHPDLLRNLECTKKEDNIVEIGRLIHNLSERFNRKVRFVIDGDRLCVTGNTIFVPNAKVQSLDPRKDSMLDSWISHLPDPSKDQIEELIATLRLSVKDLTLDEVKTCAQQLMKWETFEMFKGRLQHEFGHVVLGHSTFPTKNFALLVLSGVIVVLLLGRLAMNLSHSSMLIDLRKWAAVLPIPALLFIGAACRFAREILVKIFVPKQDEWGADQIAARNFDTCQGNEKYLKKQVIAAILKGVGGGLANEEIMRDLRKPSRSHPTHLARWRFFREEGRRLADSGLSSSDLPSLPCLES